MLSRVCLCDVRRLNTLLFWRTFDGRGLIPFNVLRCVWGSTPQATALYAQCHPITDAHTHTHTHTPGCVELRADSGPQWACPIRFRTNFRVRIRCLKFCSVARVFLEVFLVLA